MTLSTTVKAGHLNLSPSQEQRIQRRLATLGRRLSHFPEPELQVTLTPQTLQRQVKADLRVQLGPLGPHLVSHQAAETADLAVRQGVDDLKRQLERKQATQRGEAAYGVPSRRFEGRRPVPARPAPPPAAEEEKPDESESAEPSPEPMPFLYYG